MHEMNILHLPLEIIRAILVQAVLARGLKRGLRLRLVNKFFSLEIKDAIFSSGILDEPRPDGYRNAPFWQSYLAYKVLRGVEKSCSTRSIIRDTAKRLCLETGKSDDETMQAYVNDLSYLPFRYFSIEGNSILNGHYWEAPNERTCRAHLLAAAAYMNLPSLVRRLMAEDCDYDEINDVFGFPIQSAALRGNKEIVELLLIGGEGPTLNKKLLAVREAAFGSHVEILDLVMRPEWGGLPLTTGIMSWTLSSCLVNSNSIDYFKRVASVMGDDLRSVMGDPFSVAIWNAASQGNEDMVRDLLRLGAPHHAGLPLTHQNRPLNIASRKGHTGIVRLLLEKEDYLDYALCEAASGGQLELVKILLHHGANVNGHARSAIVRAIELEHTEMYHYFRKQGADIMSRESGRQALEYAISSNQQSMVELLRRDGVDFESFLDYGISQFPHVIGF